MISRLTACLPIFGFKGVRLATALLLVLVGCAKDHDAGSSAPVGPVAPSSAPTPVATPAPAVATPAPTPSATPISSPTPAPIHVPVHLPPVHPPAHPGHSPAPTSSKDKHQRKLPASYYAAAVWPETPEHDLWTEAVVSSIRTDLPDLEKASDIDEFCPNYENAPIRLRQVCWLRLISGLAQFESQFNTQVTYKEPDGRMSVGLLQISDGECHFADQPNGKPNLLDGVTNLECGVQIMARLISTDGMIVGPFWSRGASAYWSTLRPPYEFIGLRLGRKSDVELLTQSYAAY